MSGVWSLEFALTFPRLPEGEDSTSARASDEEVDTSRSRRVGAGFRWHAPSATSQERDADVR